MKPLIHLVHVTVKGKPYDVEVEVYHNRIAVYSRSIEVNKVNYRFDWWWDPKKKYREYFNISRTDSPLRKPTRAAWDVLDTVAEQARDFVTGDKFLMLQSRIHELKGQYEEVSDEIRCNQRELSVLVDRKANIVTLIASNENRLSKMEESDG